MNEFFLGILEITAGMSLLILVMLLGLKLIGGKFTAKCRYILWTLVMIRLAVPLGFGILPALIEVPVETEPEPVQIQMQTPVVEYTPVPQNPVTVQPQEQVQMPNPPVQTPVFTEPEPEPLTWDDVITYIPHAYLTGAAVFLLWNLLSYWIYTAKILRTAREADEETQEIYEAVCWKKVLHHPPILLVSPDVNSPAAFGLLRRRIVLPDIVFTENGLAGTLSHEVIHCKRGDLWIKAVCLLARTFHWFNPLVHLAAFRCEMEMELSCDEAVLAGCSEDARAAYGEVMLDIIKRCRRNRGALTTHFNPKKNAVKARFANILYGSGKKRGLWLIGVCLVLCLIAGAIVACRTDEADIPEDAMDERNSILWTYTLSDTVTLSYGTDDNDEYYLYASGKDGVSYPLTKVSLELFQYGSNETLHETLPLHAVKTDTGYLFYLRYHIQHAYFYEFTLIYEEDQLVFESIRMLSEEEAKELGVYSTEMVTVTSLEELADYVANGIITQGLYDFYYSLLSGKSDIPEYNTLQIEDYTIRFTIPMTEYSSCFSFTVTESGLDTLPPGTYDWQVLDIREVTVSGRSADNSAYTDIPEVQKLFAFFGNYFAYNTPFYGEKTPHPAIHNYIIKYYGINGSIDRDEYMRIAEAEFGITDFSPLRLEDWTDENGRLFSGGVGGGWFGEVTEVWEHEETKNVHITIQFYADCNYLLKSHRIAYTFGYDGTWRGYSFVSRSAHEPGFMYFAEYGNVYEGITPEEVRQIPMSFPFADMTLTVPAVWENIAIVKTSETGFGIYEKTANEYWNSRDKTSTGGGYVCSVTYYTKDEFVKLEERFRETEGIDVYAEGFGHSVVLGTDDTHVYTMVEATDVPWDGVPDPSEAQYKQIQYQMQMVLTAFMEDNGITPNPTCPASEVYAPANGTATETVMTEFTPDIPLDESNREYLICAASYGKSMIHANSGTIYPGTDGEGYVVLGIGSHFNKTGVCREYHTYKVVSSNNTIVSVEETETFSFDLLREKGTPYTGPLPGMYTAKSYSMRTGGRIIRTIYLKEDGTIDASAFLDGTDAGGTYSGTYTYDSTDGTFSAELTFKRASNGEITVSESQYLSGKLYKYGGFVHFLCEESELPDLEPTDPLPLTFIPNYNGSMDPVPVRYDDVFGGDWYYSYTEDNSEHFYYFSLDVSSQLLRFYTGIYEGEYTSCYAGTFTVNPMTYEATANLRDIRTESNDPDMTIRFDMGWNSGGRDGVETLLVTFNGCNAEKYASLTGQTLAFTREPQIPVNLPTLDLNKINTAVNPMELYRTFLDTVVAPYENYIASKEFLDLDGNGITELILYDYGMGVGEIFTIEGGEVRSLYTGDNILTHYSDDRKALAPPSLGAGEYVFYASHTPEDEDKTWCKNWFIPSPLTGGYVLYSSYGNTVSRNDHYYHFYSGEDTVLGKVLCVAELSRFELEAIESNTALGWECWHQGEKVTKSQYMDRLEECWNVLEQTYGVIYTEEETNHYLDELRKTPDTSFELLADLLDTLQTENPQAYISRGLYGEVDPANRYAAWGFYGAEDCARRLAVNYTFEPLTAMEVQETASITLYSSAEGEWTIHGWVNSNYIVLVTGGQSYFFRAAYKYGSDIYFGDTLKNWFDQAEYAAMPYQAVIPDTGQGFLAAAQTFVESWYDRNLQVSSGSEYAYSYVSCFVRDAENREYLIENGFIEENTYTYYITVVFVPENTKAEMYYMAGNTGLYSGDDLTVPANAYEFQRCGYIALEEDGWHGEVGGTGW